MLKHFLIRKKLFHFKFNNFYSNIIILKNYNLSKKIELYLLNGLFHLKRHYINNIYV